MKAKFPKLFSYIVLAFVFLGLAALNIFCHDHWLDSDMAAEMIFSKLLAGEGRFFATPNWYYSTEFRFLYTHWIMGPLFRVLGNWHVIRVIVNLLSYVLMLASYYFFMKPFQVRRGLVILTSVILLLPFSETMMTHMVMGNTYMFHVIIVFLTFGCYLRLVGIESGEGKQGGKSARKWIGLFCYVGLSLICGVSGVRYLLALQCPLVVTAFICLIGSTEFQQFRRSASSDRLTAGAGAVWKSREMKYFSWSLLGAVCSVAGYGINALYVSRHYVFQTYDSTNFIAVYQGIFLERLQNAIGSLLMLFGYIPDRSVLSLRGLITILAFVMLGIFAYCTKRVCSRDREERENRSFVCRFFLVSFFVNLFVFVFTTSTMVPRYYITTFVFVLPVVCFFFEKEKIFLDKLIIGLLLGGCLFLASGKTVLSYLTADKNETKRDVAEFLLEEGYSFGYASYWNANIITELTDGEVEIANIGDPLRLEYFKWSSPMKYYESGYHTGKVFLLLTAEEASEYADAPSVQQGEEIYRDEAYVVYVYGSAEELMDLAVQGNAE